MANLPVHLLMKPIFVYEPRSIPRDAVFSMLHSGTSCNCTYVADYLCYMRSEDYTAATVKFTVFWFVDPCVRVEGYRLLRNPAASFVRTDDISCPDGGDGNEPLKRTCAAPRLHKITIQSALLLVVVLLFVVPILRINSCLYQIYEMVTSKFYVCHICNRLHTNGIS